MWRGAKRILVGVLSLLVMVAVSGATYQWNATRKDLARTPPPGRLVDVGGHRLHIWCMGRGTPTVILDSGLGGGAFDWPLVQPEVAKFTQVCSYDRAGMGYSGPGPTPRTSGQIAKELAELLQQSGIERPVILVGFSFGGFNMRMFASVYTDEVAGFVLVDASHEDQGERYAEAGMPSDRPPYARLVPIAASLGILRLMGVSLGASPESAEPSVRDFVRATAYRTNRFQTMYDELIHTRDSGAQLRAKRRELTMPLVVLSAGRGTGRRAEINRELQRDQAKLSSRSCQVIAERSSHGIAGDQPELIVEAIQAVMNAAGNKSLKPGC